MLSQRKRVDQGKQQPCCLQDRGLCALDATSQKQYYPQKLEHENNLGCYQFHLWLPKQEVQSWETEPKALSLGFCDGTLLL